MLNEHNYNPDVLSCIANLSSDEVFTPPKMANAILDLLPQDIWQDKSSTFLDPFCKSGVFLREIARRLDNGLEKEIPDKQKRVNHIFSKQIYGISITELTALLSRRSVYCSKIANGKYSVCNTFQSPDGNIRFKRIEHTWENGKCLYCGASQANYERGSELETHAYEFIHTEKPEEIFKMKFDVIVGNPPYQLSDSGHGASAGAIYPQFVEQAKKLDPRFLCMIIPSRWFAGGGRSLPQFREQMLKDDRVRVIHDFPNAKDCFPGVEIKGGVNYFLWDRANRGLCAIHTHIGDQIVSSAERPLFEDGTDTFIRYNDAISILRRVRKKNEDSFSSLVSANDPFGFDVREENSQRRVKPKFKKIKFPGSVSFYYNGWKRNGIGYIGQDYVRRNSEWVDKNKILVPKAIGSGDVATDLIKPIIPDKDSCCSETYIVIGPFKSQKQISNVLGSIKTKFFHFLVGLKKNTQEARRSVYQFVPMQNFNEPWSDEKLYRKYDLTKVEISFIESMIRSME